MTLTKEQRQDLESIADKMEGIARNTPEWRNSQLSVYKDTGIEELFRYAWSIKQLARKGTASEGI